MSLKIFKIIFLKIIILYLLFFENFIFRATAIKNFELQQEKYIDSEHIMFYSHIPTRIKLIAVQSPDEQQLFSVEIAFKTPTQSNKGVAHVVEHCLLNGSKNYPIKNLPYMLKKVYPNSKIDAITYHDYTRYTIGTSSKKDFLPVFDIVWDSIFNPLFLDDKKIFKKETFSYDAINRNLMWGSVLREIFGTYSISQKNIFRSINKQLFDNSFQYDCGGTPWNLFDLSYKEVVDFYKNYYNFSNMLIVLRGNYNLNNLLTYFENEYFLKKTLSSEPKDVELQTIPSQGVSTRYFVSEYDSSAQDEGDKIIASYLIRPDNLEDFFCALVLNTVINSKSLNFKKLSEKKGYNDLILRLSGGYNKIMSFECTKKSNLDLTLKKFEIDLKETLNNFLETLTEKYLCDVCESIKKNMRGKIKNEKISALTFFNNFVYYNDPLKDIENYSQDSIQKSLDKICNVLYLKRFITDNVVDNKNYTVGVFYPKKNLNKSLIESAVKKLHDFIIGNKIINEKNEKNGFEERNLANNDDVFSIINFNAHNEKFVNWRKYFNE